jgi:hypothetical protein
LSNEIETNDGTMVRTSPLSLEGLRQLFLSPRAYFANPQRLLATPEVWGVAYLTGVVYAMNRVDVNLMKADLGRAPPLASWISDSWSHYWVFVLVSGAVCAWVIWYLGGWWFRMRLRWSGATEVDRRNTRAVYVYQDFVESAPALLVALVQLAMFPNYGAAWSEDEIWSSVTLIFVIWSCVTSYKAAVAGFEVTVWKARLWFLVLPLVAGAMAFGVVGAMYSLLYKNAA